MTADDEKPQPPHPAPAGHYWATIKGRFVLIAALTNAQSMVVGTLIHQAKNGTISDNISILGKLGALFQRLIVNAEDRDWLEEGILLGDIQLEDFAFVFLATRVEEAQPPAAPKKPRRGR